MSVEFIFLLVIFIAGFAGIFWFLARKGRQEAPLQDNSTLLMLQNQLNEVTRTLDTRLSESTRAMQSQFGTSTRIIQEITEKVTKLDETSRQVVNFADQLQSLQDILMNPKQRGVLGEYYLETVLKNVLPPNAYQMQYKLGKDEDTGKELIVDAVIIIKDKVIPIDSKFSLENYNRIIEERDPAERERLEKLFKTDLKNRIDETAKYVNPSMGTFDFAFMFIPSETIYYDLAINQVGAVKVNTQDLIQYASGEKHVHIVSPNSFYAFLQTIMQGLKMMTIEESAKEIRKRVEELGKHLQSYDMYMQKLGNNLGTTVNMYNSAYKEFGKIDKDVFRISGERMGIEPQTLIKPPEEEA